MAICMFANRARAIQGAVKNVVNRSSTEGLSTLSEGYFFEEQSISIEERAVSRLQGLKDREQIKETLDWLDRWGLGKLDPLLYSSLLRLCAEAKALAEGKRVHAHIRETNYAGNTFLSNLVVYMYGKCGSLEDARKTFDSITQPNMESYNILIEAFTGNGHLQGAVDLFEKMPEKDIVSWNSMLKTFIKRGYFADARDLFLEMPDRNVVSWNTMLSAYAQNGQPDKAWALFLEMPERSVVSWNGMIAAYARNGYLSRALQLYWNLFLEGVRLTKNTFIVVLDVCGASSELEVGRHVHARIVESGFDSDLQVMNALVTMYGKCRSLEDAVTAFDKMLVKDAVSWNTMIAAHALNGDLETARNVFDGMVFRNEMTWTAMVLACAQHGQLQEARNLLEEMPEKSLVAFDAMILAYAENGDLVGAERLFDSMEERDVLVWNSMVAAYAQNGHPKEALELFRKMDLEGFQPNTVTFATTIDACTSLGALAEGRAIHRELVVNGFIRDVRVQTAVVNMYAKCGSLAEACLVFDKMPLRKAMTWSVMISAYAQNGRSSRSLELFHLMNLEGVQPDSGTFVNILSACSHADLPNDGAKFSKFFIIMIECYGIMPTVDHYTCMIDLLGQAERLDDAEDLINNMPFHPDAKAWTSLAAACEVHKDETRGVRVAKHSSELEPEVAEPYLTQTGRRRNWDS